jgi:putative phosphoribosyl transferase
MAKFGCKPAALRLEHIANDPRSARLVLAVPVAPPETLTAFAKEADETICLDMPAALGAIGHYYRDLHQMSDAQVTDLLTRATRSTGPPAP